MKFKIGDHVRCLYRGGIQNCSLELGPYVGSTGVIVTCSEYSPFPCGVCFYDGFEGGHDFTGLINAYTGWWCAEDALELIEPKEDLSVNVNLEEVL